MVYCMSDIHGEIERFHQMLNLIELRSDDHLYIIGDVIDRYPGGAVSYTHLTLPTICSV